MIIYIKLEINTNPCLTYAHTPITNNHFYYSTTHPTNQPTHRYQIGDKFDIFAENPVGINPKSAKRSDDSKYMTGPDKCVNM